jgi:hypothetical protein
LTHLVIGGCPRFVSHGSAVPASSSMPASRASVKPPFSVAPIRRRRLRRRSAEVEQKCASVVSLLAPHGGWARASRRPLRPSPSSRSRCAVDVGAPLTSRRLWLGLRSASTPKERRPHAVRGTAPQARLSSVVVRAFSAANARDPVSAPGEIVPPLVAFQHLSSGRLRRDDGVAHVEGGAR